MFIPFVATINAMKNDFAWMAGYIDGDGCFYTGTTFQPSKNIFVYEAHLQVGTVEEINLIPFRSYGGAVRCHPAQENRLPFYVWTLKDIDAFASDVLPYLTEKREDCLSVQRLRRSIRESNYQKVDEQTKQFRLELIQAARENRMSEWLTEERLAALKKVEKAIVPSEIDFIYLAGFIEAEGCFRIKRWMPKGKPNPVYCITLEVSNARATIFDFLLPRFGGSISGYRTRSTGTLMGRWTLSAAELTEILPTLHSCLRFRKKDVCAKLIEFSNTILPNGGDRHSEAFKRQMNEILAHRERLVAEIHALNKKGSHQVPSGCHGPSGGL